MKPRLISFCLASILSAAISLAQECASGRYHIDSFTDVTVIQAIPFGSNTAVAGGAQTLYMDVYLPQDDALEERPVVLVAFGGSFIAGSRADVAIICQAFARRGFVAVAPDYRIGFFLPNELATTMAVLRGAHDMKACVRYLRNTVEVGENPYGIDPERIIVGGVSAGAVSALHAAYLDDETEWPTVLASQYAALGGVEGISGTPDRSSDVLAVFSFSGALGDTTWMEPEDVPVCSVHEVGDEVVPYYTQEVSVLGFATGLIASGSHDIHLRAQTLDLDNCLLTYPGNDHVGYLNSDQANSLSFVMDFCADLVCDTDADCGNVIAATTMSEQEEGIRFYPNPTQGTLWVDAASGAWVRVLNDVGQTVLASRVLSDHHALDLTGLAEGVYSLHAEGRRPSLFVFTR